MHLGGDARGLLRPALDNVAEHADVLLLAGDLTRHGTMDEARVAAEEFSGPAAPGIAVETFVGHTIERSRALRGALAGLATDLRIALTHCSPVPERLRGEPPEIWVFFGCYQLGEVIDESDVDLAVHGHAHFGSERGLTPGGVRVRNLATYGLGS